MPQIHQGTVSMLSSISRLTRDQARDIDRRAIRDYGISGLVLMENAGRGCADLLCRLGISGPVVIACGKGNNGGDGFVVARHLDLRGHSVQLLVWGDVADFPADAAANYQIAVKLGLPMTIWPADGAPLAPAELARIDRALSGAEWIVDALLGTGARGNPRPPLDAVIARLNDQPTRKLAIDIPSGLDCDTGEPATPTFRADYTATFVAPKVGFANPAARPFLGEVRVCDIGFARG